MVYLIVLKKMGYRKLKAIYRLFVICQSGGRNALQEG